MIANRTRRLILRLTPEEYEKIERRFRKSMFRNISEYSRAVLLKKPVTLTYRDQSMDDVLEELILLRRELNYIGNNFNQAVYKLNSVMGMPEAKLWQEALTVLRDQLEPSLRKIKVRLDDYSEIWSKSLPVKKR